MIGGIGVSGMDLVRSKLNAGIRKAPKRTKRGLIRFALLVFRDSSLMVPVQFGNLRASGFVVWGSGIGAGASPTFRIEGTSEGISDSKRATISRLSSDHQTVIAQEQGIVKSIDATRNLVSVSVCYSAYYAIYVHERQELHHREGKSWKFLQKSLNKNLPYARTMVAGEFPK